MSPPEFPAPLPPERATRARRRHAQAGLSFLLAVVLGLVPAALAGAQTAVPEGFSVSARQELAGPGGVVPYGAGDLVASPLEWSAILRTSDGGALGLGGINISRGSDQLVLYTPAWGDRTRTHGGIELVLRAAEPVGLLGRPTAVELLELRGLRPLRRLRPILLRRPRRRPPPARPPAPSGSKEVGKPPRDMSTPTTTAPSKPGLSPLLRNPEALKAIASAVRPNGSRKARAERLTSPGATGSPEPGAQEPSTTTAPPTEPPGHQDLALATVRLPARLPLRPG